MTIPKTVQPHDAQEHSDDGPLLGPHGGALRVLVVGIFYAPDHTGIAPYATQACEYLVQCGATVTVFTGVPHYPGWKVDPWYRWRLRTVERRDRYEIRRLRHYVPNKQDALRRAAYELTFGLHVAAQRPSERPDVVLAVVPSLFSAVAAERIARRAGAPLVVWVQDLMGRAAEQSGMVGGSTVAGAVAAVERRVLQRANRVLVLNSRFAEYVTSVGVAPGNVAICPNWTHVAEPSGNARDATRAGLGWRSDQTIVLHTGNMGLKQDLENVVEAARLADPDSNPAIKFVLMGDGNQRTLLERQARGVAALEFRPPAASAEYPDILAAADILLVNERPSSVDMSLPSKLTSYLQTGRPVLAASPAAGGTAAEVERSGGGVVVTPGNPAALLAGAVQLASDPARANTLAAAGRAYADAHLAGPGALQNLFDSPHASSQPHPAMKHFRSLQTAVSPGHRWL